MAFDVRKNNVFDFLLSIAEKVGLKDNNGNNILANRFRYIKHSYSRTVLESFLNGYLNCNDNNAVEEIIYPFGFNDSQIVAVQNALTNKISVVEGPPGTGKTQTILNLIANLVMQEKKVAVVSSNNSAISNVQEKLRNYGVDFITALLGSYENKQAFINNQTERPSVQSWVLNDQERLNLKSKVVELAAILDKKLKEKNQLAAKKKELDEVHAEYVHFQQYYSNLNIENDIDFIQSTQSSKILNLWLWCENSSDARIFPNLLKRLFYRFKYRIKHSSFYRFSITDKIALCQNAYYVLRIDELDNEIAKLTKDLDAFNFEKIMNEYVDCSMKIFRGFLASKYSDKGSLKFSQEDLKNHADKFLNVYPVILSTTYSITSSLSNKVKYDYIIIDEASQVDVVTGALALASAYNTVIVGDLKQLPNVVDKNTAIITDEIFDKYSVPEAYRYKNHSLLRSIIEVFPQVPRILLKEHYRCHPKIIEFCNKKFYNDELVVLTNTSNMQRMPILVYETVSGKHEYNHVNRRQIEVIIEEVVKEQHIDLQNDSVGIITPYVNQTKELRQAFRGTNVKIDTVDKFQGRENNIIILSTVDDKIGMFADDPNRLNVIVSRAVEQLIVVTSEENEKGNSNLSDLISYVQYNNFSVKHSQISSVFDYLYTKHNEYRKSLLKSRDLLFDSPAEKLIYELISNDIIKRQKFLKFKLAVHVPLNNIIQDYSQLSANEFQYVVNDLTHVDFLVFDKFSMLPVLVIEVDGVTYHAAASKQAERDIMKNTILTKYNIPCLRLRTDESNEKQRIIDALRRVIYQ